MCDHLAMVGISRGCRCGQLSILAAYVRHILCSSGLLPLLSLVPLSIPLRLLHFFLFLLVSRGVVQIPVPIVVVLSPSVCFFLLLCKTSADKDSEVRQVKRLVFRVVEAELPVATEETVAEVISELREVRQEHLPTNTPPDFW